MRWGDMDALGHMNNTVYFRYLEQARISWFDSIGCDYRTQAEGPILGSISCRFVLPAVYPADAGGGRAEAQRVLPAQRDPRAR
jgi:acyl-CoA thioester hydrolase